MAVQLHKSGAIILIFLAMCSRSAFCQSRSPTPEKDKKHAELVAQLVSPNTPPEITQGRRSVKFPADYVKDAQRAIDTTRHKLLECGRDAFPALVEALNDDRYCLTDNVGEEHYFNRTVGEICDDVLKAQLEVYRPKMSFIGPSHWRRYDYPVSKEWWHTRRQQPLLELQLQAIDWAINKRKEDDFQVDKRSSEVAAMLQLREELAESKKPAPRDRLSRMALNDYQSPR